jgi:hypothetical protein
MSIISLIQSLNNGNLPEFLELLVTSDLPYISKQSILPRAVKSTDFNNWIYPFFVSYYKYQWRNNFIYTTTLA